MEEVRTVLLHLVSNLAKVIGGRWVRSSGAGAFDLSMSGPR
jgi:hypothetical protein